MIETVRHHSLFPPRDKANVVSAPARCAEDSMCAEAAASSCVLYHRPESVFTGFLFPHADFVQALAKLGCVGRKPSTDDHPFIVLTETKFSIRYIPVWARYSPLRTRVEAHAITLSP